MLRVAIIRCQQTEDMCPGTTDFKVAREGMAAFETTGAVEIVGFVSCGGCPGKRAAARAKMMVERGAQAIALASCIVKGTPIGFACPHAQVLVEAVRRRVGPDIPILDYTH
ncbi:MAG: CGGC domain-containing protein [Thermoguttaceae bacterium]|jgi:predicted metal-binding protein